MPGSFSDNAYSAGDFTAEWTSSRFTITPIQGPSKNKPLKLSGVWEMSGMGFAQEGVNLIFSADGSGQAVKITTGREAPNEISLKMDPLVLQNVVAPMVCPPGRRYKFSFVFQQVDPAGFATFERRWTGCVVTGNDSDTPSDNAMGDTLKFKPTRRG